MRRVLGIVLMILSFCAIPVFAQGVPLSVDELLIKHAEAIELGRQEYVIGILTIVNG